MGIKIWPLCCYRPHKPHNFVIASIIKMLKSFQNSISSKAKLNWREPPASAPFGAPSTPLPSNWPPGLIVAWDTGSSYHPAVPLAPSAQRSQRWLAMKRKSDSGEVQTLNWPFSPHSLILLLLRSGELYCRALLSSWCWCKGFFFLSCCCFSIKKKLCLESVILYVVFLM